TVSTTRGAGQDRSIDRVAALRKPTSNRALCATQTVLWANSRNAGSTSVIGGACITMAVVMPVSTVIIGGTGTPGFTSDWNSPSTCPPRTLTAPISVIAEPDGEPPVVSRSTTTKVTSCNGTPRSAKLGCT